MNKHSVFILGALVGGLLATSVTLFLITPPDQRTLSTMSTQAKTLVRENTKGKSLLSPTPTDENIVTVKRVIDGDTIELESGQKVRYIGINTPEISGRKIPQCFALAAKEKNRELVEGKQIRLEKDVSETDKYGRLLRFVYTAGASGTEGASGIGDVFVNEYLVSQGYARIASFPPDISRQEIFLAAERTARAQNKGLWNDCPPIRRIE